MKVQELLKLLVLSIVLAIQASAMDVCPLPVGYVISRDETAALAEVQRGFLGVSRFSDKEGGHIKRSLKNAAKAGHHAIVNLLFNNLEERLRPTPRMIAAAYSEAESSNAASIALMLRPLLVGEVGDSCGRSS